MLFLLSWFQLFCQREAAAQRVEDEEAQEEAENEKNKKDQDESGVWKESDSGLEWVMNPADEEKEKAAEETNNALEDEGANFTKGKPTMFAYSLLHSQKSPNYFDITFVHRAFFRKYLKRIC